MTCVITESDLEFLGLRPNIWQSAQIGTISPYDKVNLRRFSIGRHWTSITTGPYNQDVICLINGPKGTGKSNFMLAEGHFSAVLEAEILGGTPEDYFNIDNICIMDPDSIIETLTKPEKYQIIGLDDNGTVNGAREFRSDLNRWVNNILVTNRPQHNIVMQTTPDQGHVDKQAREIGGYYIEMLPNEAARAHGFSVCKFFKRTKNFRIGKGMFQYPYWNDGLVYRIVVERAPKHLEEEYEKKREIFMKKAWRHGLDKDAGTIEDITSPQERKMTKAQLRAKAKADAAQADYENLARTTSMTHLEILKELNIRRRTWYEWKQNGYITILDRNDYSCEGET